MKEIKEILNNSKIKKAISIIAVVFIALVIFQAGMFVGFKKASFSFRTGEKYFRQINGRPDGVFMGMDRDDFSNSHGAAGKIINIKLPSIIVSDRDGTEKTINISTSTDIREFKGSIKAEDLKVNDFIIVIGSPNDKAEVEAKLIRIMPAPENIPVDNKK